METGFDLLGDFQDSSGHAQLMTGQPLTTSVVSHLAGVGQEAQTTTHLGTPTHTGHAPQLHPATTRAG